MPCVVTREEAEWYEKKWNHEKYGVHALDGRIMETVACELAHLIEKHGLKKELSKMAKKWILEHNKADKKRKND